MVFTVGYPINTFKELGILCNHIILGVYFVMLKTRCAFLFTALLSLPVFLLYLYPGNSSGQHR